MSEKPSLASEVSDERFRLLVNSVTDYAIYMLDPDGLVATWNSGARRFKGYEAEEIIGHSFSRFFTPEDRERELPQRILATARTQGRFEGEGWRIRKDGTRIWVHVVVDPIRDDAGALIGYAKITRDVTERREAEMALAASERRFRLLVQGVRDYAIYMLDPHGTITNWNAGAQAIKGYAEPEIVGRHFSCFYTEEDRARGEPAKALQTALSEGRYEREAQRLRKDGTTFWAHVVIDPIHDDMGRLVGFAKITRDITERRRAQQELEDARAALFQAQKLQALGELTGGIAHDFNNLMTVIRGSAELLERDDLPAERRRRYARAITETADRASTLTSHLLAFGRRQALRPEVLDLGVRLDALGEVLARTLSGSIEIRLEIASDLWMVEVDPAELETALLNAAFNARDAMPAGGRLTLSAVNRPQDDMVRVAISDTGTGMPREVLERAFEPFFTTKPVGKGTGLGLSQIHGFAAQTGGRAEIRSAPGEGTTVALLLPRSLDAVPAQIQRDPDAASFDGIDVLLVEDNDHVREFARHLLEDLRCAVTEAGSAEEATLLLAERRFHLVLSDIVMPGMSGLELARQLRDTMPEQPLLLATGYSREVASGAAGGFEILQKPYGVQTLAAAMARVLNRGVSAGSAVLE